MTDAPSSASFASVGGFPPLWMRYGELTDNGPSEFGRALHRCLPAVHSFDDLLALARQRGGAPIPHADRLATAIDAYLQPYDPPEPVRANLQRLREPGTVAVVTGQQPVLLGGPGYVLYKALTTIRLANELTARGVPAVPVFWNASEDHDIAEANAAFVPRRNGRNGRDGRGWRRTVLDALPAFTRHPLSAVPLPESARDAFESVRQTVEGGRAPAWQPGDTLASWQTRALVQALGEFGLVVVEPDLLRPFAVPVLQAAVQRHDELLARLDETVARLSPHLPGLDGFRQHHSFVFYLADTPNGPERRRLLQVPDGGFEVEDGPDDIARDVRSPDEWARLVESHPRRFSPNALLRPLLQNAALPTVAYVAGPAELAYNALGVPWHELLGIQPAAPVRRLSATVVPGGRDVSSEDVVHAFDARARARTAREELVAADQQLLDSLALAVARVESDRPPAAAIQQSLDRFGHAVQRRVARNRQSRVDRSVRLLADVPSGVEQAWPVIEPVPHRLQERTLPWLQLIGQGGNATIRRWLDAMPPLPDAHLVLDG